MAVIKPYQVKIVSVDNQLQGEEAAIRQLMYDFYFTLPLYPEGIEMNWPPLQIDAIHQTNTWALDSTRLYQWGQLAQLRISQGYFGSLSIRTDELRKIKSGS